MLNQTPKLAEGLIVKKIDESYSYAVNSLKPRSLRILTKSQHAFLDRVGSGQSINDIAAEFSTSSEIVLRSFGQLADAGMISFDDKGFTLTKPRSPKALSFWIHTTNRCNLNCNYCYISTLKQTGGMPAQVQIRLIEKLAEVARKRSILKIKLRLAGGEPLSEFRSWRKFVVNAREQLEAVGCELSVSVITNLTLLTEEMVQFACDEKISFGISLDGIGLEHDKTRAFSSGRGSFAILKKNLLRLLENQIAVSTTTVVTNSNLLGLKKLTEYLIGLDIPFRYSIVRGQDIDATLLEETVMGCFEIMKEAVSRGWSLATRFQFCDLKPSELGFQTCDSGFSGGAINVDGTFKYCHTDFGKDDGQVMSVFRDDLDLVEMIKKGPHLEETKSADCKVCKYRAICTSGCPVYRKNGKDPQCSIYHKLIPHIYDLYALERLQLLRKHGIV